MYGARIVDIFYHWIRMKLGASAIVRDAWDLGCSGIPVCIFEGVRCLYVGGDNTWDL